MAEELLRQHAVERTLPAPGWADYATDLASALARWLADSLSLSPAARRGVAAVTLLLVALVAVLALAWAARALLGRRRLTVLEGLGHLAARPSPTARERGPEDWGRELARRLELGEAGAALEALWWWLATSITDGRVDPAWTSQELVLRSQRPLLLPHVRVLDRLTYGGLRPPLEDVRHLASRLQEALA